MSVSDEDDVSLADYEEKQEEDYPEDAASKQGEVKKQTNKKTKFIMMLALMFIINVKRIQKTGLMSYATSFTLRSRIIGMLWKKMDL